MRRLIVQPKARLDLLEIWHHIVGDSRQNADRVLASLEDALRDFRRLF
jgi:plasmid stabilization system protein ParE